MVIHGFDLHHTQSGGVGQGRTGHSGENNGSDDIHVSQGSPFPADNGVGKPEDHIRHLTAVHNLRHKDEQRHGNENKLRVHIGEELSGRHTEIRGGPGSQGEVEQRGHQHPGSDGNTDQKDQKEAEDKNNQCNIHLYSPFISLRTSRTRSMA